MKTNREWIKELDSETTEKFMYGFRHHRQGKDGYMNQISLDFYDSIARAFTWDYTPEGAEFWYDVANKAHGIRAEEYDTRCTDAPVCPYCGAEQTDAWEMDFGEGIAGEGALECGECVNEFHAERVVAITYNTKKRKMT